MIKQGQLGYFWEMYKQQHQEIQELQNRIYELQKALLQSQQQVKRFIEGDKRK